MPAVTVKHNKFSVTELPTMTSLEMVDYINADRKSKAEIEGLTFPSKKYRKLQHKDFLKKVSQVLGEKHSAKFFAQYKDSTCRDLPCYNFPKREACLLTSSPTFALCDSGGGFPLLGND